MSKYIIGIDYGTLSGRCVLVDAKSGEECAESVLNYPHGVIDTVFLDGTPLPDGYALQHPSDYLDVLRFTIADVLDRVDAKPSDVAGIGIDFTACTVLPVDGQFSPLCMKDGFRENKHAYVKLWKHHAAQYCSEEATELALRRQEPWLNAYGGTVSCEWMLPKVLQVAREAPEVFEATHRFMEAADWLSYELTGKETHSAVFAGYKGLWNATTGYPSNDYMKELDPLLDGIIGTKISADVHTMDGIAGYINENGALVTGLEIGTPVALPMIDAHASMAALNVTRESDFIAVVGTSIGQMVNSAEEKTVDGICGYVRDGVIPGLYTYEAGQAAVGDTFAWFIDNCVPSKYESEAKCRGVSIHTVLEEKARKYLPGQSGLMAINWWNGSRSLPVNYALSGMILGMTLRTRPEEIYRALLESTVYGLRRMIEQYESSGIRVGSVCLAGGIAKKNELMMQIYADVLNREVKIAQSAQSGAFGSAMYAAVAAGLYASVTEAADALASKDYKLYTPDPENAAKYESLYREYLELSEYFSTQNKIMERLRERT